MAGKLTRGEVRTRFWRELGLGLRQCARKGYWSQGETAAWLRWGWGAAERRGRGSGVFCSEQRQGGAAAAAARVWRRVGGRGGMGQGLKAGEPVIAGCD